MFVHDIFSSGNADYRDRSPPPARLSTTNNTFDTHRERRKKMMSWFAMAALVSSMAAWTAAYNLPFHSVSSRHQYHGAGGDVVSYAHPRLSNRKSWRCRARPSLRSKGDAPETVVSSSTHDDDACVADDSIVTGVTLKMAFDSSPLWGVADLSESKSERFTSPESLDMVHRLRRESSAVLVGRGTVERDDCSLTVRRVRLGDGQNQPVRVVLDPSLSLIGGDYTILKDGLPTIIYHLNTPGKKEKSNATTMSDNITLIALDGDADGGFSLSPSDIVKDLAARGLQHVMVEGGPATARAFLEESVVDRAILVRAPFDFEIPVPAEIDKALLRKAGLKMIGTTDMGGDSVEYWTRNGMPWVTTEFHRWP
ncbi:hypothetical protein ACHAWF_010201 [Thalassiosira exigua]